MTTTRKGTIPPMCPLHVGQLAHCCGSCAVIVDAERSDAARMRTSIVERKTLEAARPKRTGPREVVVRGERMTVAAASRRFHVNDFTIWERVGRGLTGEQAVGLDALPVKHTVVTAQEIVVEVEGVKGNLREVCRRRGVPDARVRGRLRNGWTLRQAFGMDPAPPRGPRSQTTVRAAVTHADRCVAS